MIRARPGRTTVRGCSAAVLLAALAFSAAQPGQAQPVTATAFQPRAGATAVLDIRAEDACLERSLPEARCLPAPWLLADETGNPIGFHALRWLLGTVGLSGNEPLAVYAGPDGPTPDAWAVAALAYLAGQADVAVIAGASPETGDGWSRSLTREAVYVAPMRIEAMTLATGTTRPVRDQLVDFAQGRADLVAFAPGG